ncbi:MAG TPA: dodecin family protein [Gemmatimonas sp.]|nr:dodecin family protein [Gemmatimonas sp.]
MATSDSKTSVAKVIEISARSSVSFEAAIQGGIERASQTMRGITSAWVKEQRVEIREGKIANYQVNLMLTFTLED